MSLAKTPVSILQELLQKTNKIPEYTLLPSEGIGTHNPTFQYRVDAVQVMGFGKARSKKDAKHEAAKDALAKLTELGLYIPDQSSTPPLQKSPKKHEPETQIYQINAIGILNDFVAEHKLPLPEFTEISDVGPAHQRLFTLQCNVGTLKKTATEYTKKKAKQACALLMYQCLLESLPDISDPDNDDFIGVDEAPTIDDIFQEFSLNSTNFNKKKENYKLEIADYPQTFRKIMKEKKLSFNDLWMDVDYSPSEKNLEKILNKLDLKFNVEFFHNDDDLIVTLLIDSEPNFSFATISGSIIKAMPCLIQEALDFLKISTRE